MRIAVFLFWAYAVRAMCFTVPLRIMKKNGKRALLEDGREVSLHITPKVRTGSYVFANANVAVAALTKREALYVRKLIKSTLKKIV